MPGKKKLRRGNLTKTEKITPINPGDHGPLTRVFKDDKRLDYAAENQSWSIKQKGPRPGENLFNNINKSRKFYRAQDIARMRKKLEDEI